MLTPETVLNDRYRIVGLVGQGGMGAVYEAVDQRLRTQVALKQTLLKGEAMARAFQREAQLLAGLRHPALPRVIDHFVGEEGQFLVMEFIPGQDLATALRERGGPFPLAQVLAWGDQLLDALDYLHSQSPPVIHRDIKPQNLKLTPRGEVVLLDFGLAKGAAAQAAQTTGASSLFGYTPQYAPLEQVQGTGTDPRSDLYSLGATLYHMATGQPPADTLARATAVVNARPDPLRPAHELSPEIPAAVGEALGMALALRADARFGSAGAMRNALRQALAATPPAATGPTVVARQAPTVPPPPAPAVAPRERHLALPTAERAAPEPPPAAPAAPDRRPAPPPERRGRSLLYMGLLLAALLGVLFLTLFGRGGGEGTAQVIPTAAATADPREEPPAATQAPLPEAPPPEVPPPAATAITLGEEFTRLEGAISAPGQQNAYSFTVEPGRQIFVWTVSYGQGMEQLRLWLRDAYGNEVANECMGCGNMGVQTLAQGGAYTLLVGSDSDPATGPYELRLNLVPPIASFETPLDARIAEDQPAPGAASIRAPGAKNAFVFQAEPEQQIFVWTARYNPGMEQLRLWLRDANGDEVANECLGCGNMGVQTLRQGGAYTLLVGSDSDPATGDYDLRINAVPPPEVFEVAVPFSVGYGQPAASAGRIAVPGARQAYTFAAPAGQRIFVRTVRFDAGMEQLRLWLRDANGDVVDEECLGCGDLGALTLEAGDSYTLEVGADKDAATGTYELEVTQVPY